MQVTEEQFKELLTQALENENEAARELAKEAAIKAASNFTEDQMVKILERFSIEKIESRMIKD
jgi:hypothetical protein